MTEAEWLACTDSLGMLDFVWEGASNRKRRLFAVACCRRVWNRLKDERLRKAIEAAEQHADQLRTDEELTEAMQAASALAPRTGWRVEAAVGWCCCGSATPTDDMVQMGQYVIRHICGVAPREGHAQTKLFRDIFGNPFHPPPTIEPAWLTWNDGAVVKLAKEIYDQRAFERMAELGDALEKAGCKDADILKHCRQGEAHVRGCWVVDLLLGKE